MLACSLYQALHFTRAKWAVWQIQKLGASFYDLRTGRSTHSLELNRHAFCKANFSTKKKLFSAILIIFRQESKNQIIFFSFFVGKKHNLYFFPIKKTKKDELVF